jgi:hypothetical protein
MGNCVDSRCGYGRCMGHCITQPAINPISYTMPPVPIMYPQGCICPVEAEKTCKGANCPRRERSLSAGKTLSGA